MVLLITCLIWAEKFKFLSIRTPRYLIQRDPLINSNKSVMDFKFLSVLDVFVGDEDARSFEAVDKNPALFEPELD